MAHRLSKISSAWFQDLKTQDEKDNLENYILNDKIILDKLVKIVYNISRGVENPSLKDYDTPSWVAKQAHMNGMSEAYRKILSIIEINSPE